MGLIGCLVVGFVAVWGLLIGSFLNVVIYRLPRECLSVWRQARSRCPRCGIQLRWFDNIPLVSYLILLRGRCRGCRAGISWRYPLVELSTGLAFVGLLLIDVPAAEIEYLNLAHVGWKLWAMHALITSVLIALSLIDYDYRILPDVLTKPSILIAPILVFLVPELMPLSPWQPFESDGDWSANFNALANGVVGGLTAMATLWSIGWLGSKAFRKPAMGLGDVKLIAGMGGILGFWFLMVIVVASFAGSIIGILVLAIRKDRYVPFGPFLALGMMVVMFRGPELLESVLNLMSRGAGR
ncbi:MAG: leader peptidase (prepilin peptidase)/N-methyltransferase [Planctomycetota bacterium]|jgi:leader peptidase (prepilin peptidase)/N-methyltransferase